MFLRHVADDFGAHVFPLLQQFIERDRTNEPAYHRSTPERAIRQLLDEIPKRRRKAQRMTRIRVPGRSS
jgi:hypothetical protein